MGIGYLGLFWRGDTGSPPRFERLQRALVEHAPDLKLCLSRPGLLLYSDCRDPRWRVSIDRTGTLAVIGATFDRRSLTEEGAPHVPADAVAGADDVTLLQRIWGSYVAIRRTLGPPHATILRDPSGALPVLLAEAEGFAVLAPSLPRWLRDAIGLRPEIDRQALAQALAYPLLPTHRSLLRGVHLLPAGAAFDWDGVGAPRRRTLWPPQALLEPPPDEPGSVDRLRAAVSGCVRALAAQHRGVTLELSGGLDSAIVLGALASAARPVDISCVNFAAGHSGGDERAEARAVADRWEARLVEVTVDARDLRFDALFAGEQPVDPILYGLDPILERASIGVARAFDATAIFTGQGGDAVFCHLPTPMIAVDFARAAGWRAHVSQTAFDAARRARCSLWRVQWLMLRDRFAGTPRRIDRLPGRHPGAAMREEAEDHGLRHPWVGGDSNMAPARRLQLEAIANCQHFYGPTWRGVENALVHPLLAQPVVETCLTIPTFRLASGTGNRALAREAFASWLPDIVRMRRDKGEGTSYYRRAIAENLPYLRDLLLNGTLVAEGFLNADGIDAALTDESLIWSDESRMIAAYASFEAWARYWGLGASS